MRLISCLEGPFHNVPVRALCVGSHMYCAAFSRAVPPVRVVKATQRDAMDPRVDTDASTPLSQWNAPRPWWIGADASGTGNYGTDGRDSIQVETRDNDRLDQPCSGAEAGGGLPQDRRSRDPRKIFGDLPNSSYDTGLLGDPITRELEQREANRRRPTAGPDARTWFDTGHTMSGSVPRRRSVDNRRTDQVFWREEFNRLEDQLTTLSLERERFGLAVAPLLSTIFVSILFPSIRILNTWYKQCMYDKRSLYTWTDMR